MNALQPPPVHFDAVHRFTIEDYYRLVAVGLLDADARVEIADSTLRRDLGFKASLYERAGIPEYWVVDVQHACLHVFALTGRAYETTAVRAGRRSPRTFPPAIRKGWDSSPRHGCPCA
ncbi:MAG TPA: Uma2 family endonuclease [Chthoniobacterales bacterium]